MQTEIRKALQAIGDQSGVKNTRRVSGGDINEAYYVETAERKYFIKGNKGIPSHFFQAEATGLDYIRNSNSIAVPKVYYVDEPAEKETGVIVMEWITGQTTEKTVTDLGHNLAQMHKHTNDRHGFKEDTFIGTLTQPNGYFDDWLSYYRKRRLQPQFSLAMEQGRMAGKRKAKMDKLLERLDQWIPSNVPASLLHGDLWGGNWIAGPGDKAYLIDPSVFFGDRCFEIAFTELFGGFPNRFYQAYEEVYPLPESYQDTKALYQLYYLLVHLNLFGEGYGSAVDRVLAQYV